MTCKSIIQRKYQRISKSLNERSRRLWCATEALAIKSGGVAIVHAATNVSRPTIYKGIKELTNKQGRNGKKRRQKNSDGRIRKKGGGAKSTIKKYSEILKVLETLVEPDVKGDPQSPLKWTCKSLRKIATQLKKQGYDVSHVTVRDLLKKCGYTLQLNRKEKEGKSVPDRDAQFHFINNSAKTFLEQGEPVISVDAKKKELIGNYKNAGREYHKKGEPTLVNVHDFPDKEEGKVVPYGVYDIGKNKGWVSVGITADTAEFAVNTIRDWWNRMGKKEYPNATKLLITADSGGSNGSRVRLWKWELQKLANEIDLEIHVCHFPPGTSKWNKIEHKLFSYITQNWRGEPLITREIVVQLIGNTTTTKGLKVKAQMDFRKYSTGVVVAKEDFNKIAIKKQSFRGEWNYVISPTIVFEIEQ